MDKKSYRRSSSSSSSSSTSSSTSSSSSSSSSSSTSYDSRYHSQTKSLSSHKRQSRHAKKSRSHRRGLSGGDRSKTKKSKSSASGHRHGSSKPSVRKSTHTSRKDYKDYDTSYTSRSPVSHQRRSGGSKKNLSPVHKRTTSPSTSRKSRKISPGQYRKCHKRSLSPRDRLEFPRSLASPTRLRDPRLERGIKRSPELPGKYRRDGIPFRDSPKRYDKEVYLERHERRVDISRSREDSRPREYARHKREHYEDYRRDERDKKLKIYKDRVVTTDNRDGYLRDSDYPTGLRDYYGRQSRDTSVDRSPYADHYDSYERDAVRIESRNRFELDRKIPEYDRRSIMTSDSRYTDDRRKRNTHDQWLDDPRSSSGPLAPHEDTSSHSYPRRVGPPEWEKSHKKRRDWQEDYPREDWDRNADWNSGPDRGRAWTHARHTGQWEDKREWQTHKRARTPERHFPFTHTKIAPKVDPKPFVPEVEKTPPRVEIETKEAKRFSPMSPVKVASVHEASSVHDDPISPKRAVSITEELLMEKANFSDFSDDSDDILNQEPVDEPEEKVDTPLNEDTRSPAARDPPALDGVFDDDDTRMDLEEISDDDFEEEKQIKYSVADALDIDWSALKVNLPTEKPVTQTSVIKRFSPANLLSVLGVSTKYARPEIIEDVIKRSYEQENQKQTSTPQIDKQKNAEVEQKNAEVEQKNAEVKQKKAEVKQNNPKVKQEKIEVKQEIKEETVLEEFMNVPETPENPNEEEEPPATKAAEILPVVYWGGVVKDIRYDEFKQRRFFSLGPHRKALSMLDDVCIRRRFCGQPEDETFYENSNFDCQLINQVSQSVR